MVHKLRVWAVPLGLMVVLIISFGLLMPRLGFYWDDWPVILTGRLQGTGGFLRFYQYDRPFSAWTYILTFPILGSKPLNWQVFTLLLRWTTAVALWWTLMRLWPNRQREVGFAAFLFAVYPVYTQQFISVAYSQHWICYLLFFISLGAMVQAFRSPRWFWPLTLLAVSASVIQLMTMEYFAGLELLRPIILWFLLAASITAPKARLLAVLKRWSPYGLALAGFVIWRLFFLRFPGQEANPPILLNALLSKPLEAAPRLLQIVIQDTTHLLISAWTNILAPASIDPRDRFIVFSWIIGALAALLVIMFFRAVKQPETSMIENPARWTREALILGAAGLIFGMLPVWFTDRQIIVGAYSDRFGLSAMFGASLLISALIETLIRKEMQRIILVGILVGMAASMHLRVANDFRWSWVKQTRFYWQLSWRAPALVPGTSVFSDGEIFPYVGIYSTSAGINLLYPPESADDRLPYWFTPLNRQYGNGMEEFTSGTAVDQSLRNFSFKGSTLDGIVIYYEPDQHDCLEVLTPEDGSASDLPAITVTAARNSNLGRIQAAPSIAWTPPVEIFGPEPAHDWCYLYQKATLAQQQNDWKTVVAIGDQARDQGYTPKASGSNTAFEWIPFIEGYARANRWQDAQDLSINAYERDRRIDARLCELWNRLAETLPPGQINNSALKAVRAAAGCPPK